MYAGLLEYHVDDLVNTGMLASENHCKGTNTPPSDVQEKNVEVSGGDQLLEEKASSRLTPYLRNG